MLFKVKHIHKGGTHGHFKAFSECLFMTGSVYAIESSVPPKEGSTGLATLPGVQRGSFSGNCVGNHVESRSGTSLRAASLRLRTMEKELSENL